MRHFFRRAAKACVAGAAGGAAGAWAMNRVILAVSRASRGHGAQAIRPAEPRQPDDRPATRASGDATTKVAALVAEELTATRNDLEGREPAGTAVHYSFAVMAGVAYALLVEYSGVSGPGAGAAYAAVLWFGGDFIVLPLAGLSEPAPKYGWRVEALSLAGHLAYGTVLELVRSRIRTAL